MTRKLLPVLLLSLVCVSSAAFGQSLKNAFGPSGPNKTKAPATPTKNTDQREWLKSHSKLIESTADQKGSMIQDVRFDGKVFHLSLNTPEKWNVYLSFAANKKFAYVVFPCGKIDLKNEQACHALLKQNNSAGVSRFEIRSDLFQISTPCFLSDLTPEYLNRLILVTTEIARQHSNIWGPLVAKTKKPNDSKRVIKKPATPTNNPIIEQTGTPSLGKICQNNRMRMCNMQINSVEGKVYKGLINFAPDGTYAMDLSATSGGRLKFQGKYLQEGNSITLIVRKKPGRVVKFTYTYTHSRFDTHITLRSDDRKDSISFISKKK